MKIKKFNIYHLGKEKVLRSFDTISQANEYLNSLKFEKSLELIVVPELALTYL